MQDLVRWHNSQPDQPHINLEGIGVNSLVRDLLPQKALLIYCIPVTARDHHTLVPECIHPISFSSEFCIKGCSANEKSRLNPLAFSTAKLNHLEHNCLFLHRANFTDLTASYRVFVQMDDHKRKLWKQVLDFESHESRMDPEAGHTFDYYASTDGVSISLKFRRPRTVSL